MGFFDGRDRNYSTGTDNSGNDDPYAYMKRNRTSSILVFVVIIAAYFVYTYFGGAQACGGETTTGRIRLNSDNYILLDKWYSEKGTYTDDSIVDSMINFYESTGVQPFVLVVDDSSAYTVESLNQKAEAYYKDELFASAGSTDEGHMVVAFQPSSGNCGIYVGSDAITVMDSAAVGEFRTILSSCYNKYTGTAVFDNTFKQAQSKIMGRSKATIYIIIILAVICVVYFVFNYARATKARQKEQNENGGNNQ